MATTVFREGQRVRYRNGGFTATGVIVEADLVDEEGDGGKNGMDVYSVELDAPQNGETGYWGYVHQFTAI